jgi:hypothetical protein
VIHDSRELLARMSVAEGEAAYRKGDQMSANPWEAGTAEHRGWALGWLNARSLASLPPTMR